VTPCVSSTQGEFQRIYLNPEYRNRLMSAIDSGRQNSLRFKEIADLFAD
jgi:hypothetical protein